MGRYRWTKDARRASRREVDDSLSENDMGESPHSGGIATLNHPAKFGFFPAGKRGHIRLYRVAVGAAGRQPAMHGWDARPRYRYKKVVPNVDTTFLYDGLY